MTSRSTRRTWPTAACLLLLALTLRIQASDPPLAALIAQARADAATDASAKALPELEVALELQQPLAKDLCAEYWRLVDKAEDYPRAFRFFAALAERNPREAEIVANHGRAIGCYIGWMFSHGVGEHALTHLATAEQAFTTALALDPENFTALLSRAIFHAHVPGGDETARVEFDQLEALRERHPEFDWQRFAVLKQAVLGAGF